MNDHIREAMNLRDDIRKKLKRDRHNITLLEQYKREKKRVRSLIAEGKAKYYHNELWESRSNMSKTWKTIKAIIPSSKNSPKDYISDADVDKANKFNTHFANIGKNTYEKTEEILQVQTCLILYMTMEF
ncbi:hypothetical protein Pmani_002781 [Petrolisthes manimaculis]|uniref:Uncharacterized protein n=1 Tax=Petrolisthes manimaculis TaxID=1843537 RepID=A0AAE1QHW6_9EUCA|nr:hypothetical protein Pmani_002742 [Petrolisthes manimaculis]KAK4326752.1 hypothetical protein Pmani_002769 [Petrolisthes manimaculis]KAK4326764.1 hypothetical protein Pmani_002781 [Petrolisthes manimaculis]